MTTDYQAAKTFHAKLLQVAKQMKIKDIGPFGLTWNTMPPQYHALLILAVEQMSVEYFGNVAEGERSDFFVTSGYGYNTRQPFIKLTVNERTIAQVLVPDAQNLAMNILAASEAALSDAFLFEFFKGMSIEDQQIAAMISEFRDFRDSFFDNLTEEPPKED